MQSSLHERTSQSNWPEGHGQSKGRSWRRCCVWMSDGSYIELISTSASDLTRKCPTLHFWALFCLRLDEGNFQFENPHFPMFPSYEFVVRGLGKVRGSSKKGHLPHLTFQMFVIFRVCFLGVFCLCVEISFSHFISV